MTKLNVAVIFGGYSSEHEVSKESASTIISNMCNTKYNVIPIYITKEGNWLLYDGNINNIKKIDLEKCGSPVTISTNRDKQGIFRIVGDKVKFLKVDIIFPVLHGKYGEDGTIQGIFEIANIPYVGSGVLASAVAMDKSFTKMIVKGLGINQAPFLSYKNEHLKDIDKVISEIESTIGYPCFVKPSSAGSSVGISKANNKEELINAINTAIKCDEKIVVEKFIKARELECAILGTGGADTEASLVGEVYTKEEFYDFNAKYNNAESRNIIPAEIPDDVVTTIQEISLKIFKALECKGLARVDFFLEEETNNIIFNEINTMPGFTSISMYSTLCKTIGYDIEELIDKLIETAIHQREF